ncbi:hypothetical protein [Teredinibacter sp. KSP-S5-2]|uniref:hypothetical protein n=1 Tax=Teredinibacter sp. KSP-S5-2 TaxID=3034506 RepID=UPI0029345EB6|nr:hypothetical protein [Teredinibacter sp. KSP-S5-2]WNO09991.1 hypothetical protein P5V12_02280 [Teredinibacter sp. KSP-S5-2]
MRIIIFLILLVSVESVSYDIDTVEGKLRNDAKRYVEAFDGDPVAQNLIKKLVEEGRLEVIAAINLNEIGLEYFVARQVFESLEEKNSLAKEAKIDLEAENRYLHLERETLIKLSEEARYISNKLNSVLEKANMQRNSDSDNNSSP